jgi:hypothetical protein
VLPRNTADKTTLRGFLNCIEKQCGKAKLMWLMDRRVPTKEVLSEMRTSNPTVQYLVGTPKGRLTKLEKNRQAVATSKAGCPGQMAASGRRTLRLCRKPGSGRQRARDPQASALTREGETIKCCSSTACLLANNPNRYFRS